MKQKKQLEIKISQLMKKLGPLQKELRKIEDKDECYVRKESRPQVGERINCPCKKFKAKNHSSSVTTDTPSDNSLPKTDLKEGTFNLSEKIVELEEDKSCPALWTKDVKEFIRRRNRLDMMLHNREITWEEYIVRRNNLAGKELSK